MPHYGSPPEVHFTQALQGFWKNNTANEFDTYFEPQRVVLHVRMTPLPTQEGADQSTMLALSGF